MKKRLTRWASALLLCALLVSSVPAAGAAARFSDVPANNWAAASIERCVALNLFQGETATRFGLGKPMTRAAFVVVLDRLFGWEDVTPAAGSFADVQNTGVWYFTALETALANGAVTLQNENFRPNDPITREEMAVMLVRALGYSSLAGLVLKLDMPFTDVTAAPGYISLAYELGVVNGTTATTFSPDATATREQAAVMLMRVYDKIHTQTERMGILTSADDLTAVKDWDVVAVSANQLLYSGRLLMPERISSAGASLARTAARDAGARVLLHVEGTANTLKVPAGEVAALLASAVTADGYDGLLLEFPALGSTRKAELTALAAALRTALGSRELSLIVEAPAWQGTTYGGYDYAALAKSADRLVVRIPDYSATVNGFPVSPVDPLEEVYYALGQLKDQVAPEKLSLLLPTGGTAWVGKQSSNIPHARIRTLLAQEGAEAAYYDRYGCPYLTAQDNGLETVVWYLDGRAAAQRALMAQCMGVDQICVTDLNDAVPDITDALK